METVHIREDRMRVHFCKGVNLKPYPMFMCSMCHEGMGSFELDMRESMYDRVKNEGTKLKRYKVIKEFTPRHPQGTDGQPMLYPGMVMVQMHVGSQQFVCGTDRKIELSEYTLKHYPDNFELIK